jgi:hypothetical protein
MARLTETAKRYDMKTISNKVDGCLSWRGRSVNLLIVGHQVEYVTTFKYLGAVV